MENKCFNCGKIIDNEKPICPYCFVVQRNKFPRDDLFNYLEKYLPTKPKEKEKYESKHKRLHPRNYEKWLFFSLVTFSFSYYYYLLLTLQDLNDHWFYPHENFENTTKNDVFISSVILLFTYFLGVPFIQYVRYEKLRRHLSTAPISHSQFPIPRGKRMFWLYSVLNLLFIIVFSMLFFGLSSVLAEKYFEFNSTQVAIVFFSGAAIVFALVIVFAIVLVLIEIRWQELFNKHISWHISKDILAFEKQNNATFNPTKEKKYYKKIKI